VQANCHRGTGTTHDQGRLGNVEILPPDEAEHFPVPVAQPLRCLTELHLAGHRVGQVSDMTRSRVLVLQMCRKQTTGTARAITSASQAN